MDEAKLNIMLKFSAADIQKQRYKIIRLCLKLLKKKGYIDRMYHMQYWVISK